VALTRKGVRVAVLLTSLLTVLSCGLQAAIKIIKKRELANAKRTCFLISRTISRATPRIYLAIRNEYLDYIR
jgi:uncharacterized integral membrane protein